MKNYVLTHGRVGSFQGQLLYDYPFGEENIESKIAKTLVNHTVYSYNAQGLITTLIYTCSNSSGEGTICSQYTYDTGSASKIFGAMLTETDSLGYVTKYFYDNSNGNLLAQIDVESGSGYVYDYDEFGTLISVIPATGTATSYTEVTDAENVSYEYDPNTHRLTKITTASTEYSFSYDSFGNSTGVTAGNNTLATYEYGENNGKIETINYGNGFSEEYVYNSLEMLSEIWYTIDGTRTKVYEYTYNNDGTLAQFENLLDGTTVEYTYDFQGRLLTVSETNSSDSNYKNDYAINSYDEDGNVRIATTTLNYLSTSTWYNHEIKEEYYYNKNGTLDVEKTFYLPSTGVLTYYSYDNFNRVTGANRQADDFVYITDYEYLSDGNSTSYLIGSYTSTVGSFSTTYTYTYDSKGNITTIDQDGTETSYTYDDLGQLTREIQGRVTKNYTYDDAGNITSIQTVTISNGGSGVYALQPLPGVTTTTIPLTYANSEWGDLLTSFDGTAITYDDIGNPLSYYNGSAYTFTWEGRRLIGANKGTKAMTFTYNDEGLRTSKTVNGSTTTYLYDGSRLISESTPTYTCVYIYDESGTIIGAKYISTAAGSTWQTYFFEKNLQGDVIAVYSSTGTKLISYLYDAWGNRTTTYSNGGASTLAANNRITYRGYYYDSDLGMYYLQSRYYDAKICRFINEDSYASTGQGLIGHNMFAYCGNNPIMLIDYNGEAAMPFWELIWPGEIHREIQEYLRDNHQYVLEVTVEGKRIDLVKDNNAYEIKPFTTPKFVAYFQLLEYVILSDFKYSIGQYSPELTGEFISKRGYTVKFYYTGNGVIQYKFYKEESLSSLSILGQQLNENKSGVESVIVALSVAGGGVYFALAGASGGKVNVPPFKEMELSNSYTY